MIDVSVVPSMIVPTNMTAKIDLHTSQTINSLTAQYPSQTTITSLGTVATDHKLYQLSFSQLGQNNVTVSYGTGLTTTLQFYVIEPIDAALQRHATFMVANQQWTSGDMKGLFDDWMMDSKAKRGAEGGSGWGDDWGWTHGEFLAEKNAQTPVASEVTALDTYLAAVWGRAIDPTSYIVQDWWCPVGTSATNIMDCYYDRAYAYPHAFNTYFSMYKIASLYPKLITYQQTADTYLLRAYDIIHTLYSGHGEHQHRLHGRADAPRDRSGADRRRAHDRGGVRHQRDQLALQRLLRQPVSLRLGVHLRQHRRGGRLHGGQAEQQHVGARQGQRQDARLPRAGAGLVLLRRPRHPQRRELVAVPVHRRAGRLLHGRLRSHAVDHAGGRRAAVVRRQDRQHQRHQLGSDRLERRQPRDGQLDVSGDEGERLRQQLRSRRTAPCTTTGGR